MIFNSKACILLSISALLPAIHSHGYLKSPKSRNYVANTDGLWWGGDENTPYPEDTPSGLNVGGTAARCGIIKDRNYDYPKNVMGLPLPPQPPQACYKPGSVIALETHLTAHHKGHFVYKACAINHGEVPTQECFDANPLTFVEDVSPNTVKAPKHPDPKYSDRAYIHPRPAVDFVHKFQLPENLEGDLVLIQWYYLTANSCYTDGYDDYPFPPNWHPGNIPVCDSIPPDGIPNIPEQFWNCAEVRISNDCSDGEPPVTTTSSTTTSTGGTTTEASPPNPNCPANTAVCGPNNPCGNGLCCSQWGYCGSTSAYCGECCQSNCGGANNPPPSPYPPTPSPPPPTPPTTPGFNYDANHGEDSRLIAYVGNWQTCPTDAQVDAYSHIVIAFAVSYTWSWSKNNCDATCSIAAPPTCNNQVRTDLIDQWRAKGKKVILSFGGAGMGGSWSGDQNNCWDYCFGKEYEVADRLVSIIDDQHLDGIDLDYEYCYDIEGKQAGQCAQRSPLYSDAKAQTFLNSLTSMLRTKLDALQVKNGYNRGRYEVTHAPMDSDLTPSNSAYFQILKKRRADLDFIMPQFYNGATRAHVDGLEGSGVGALSAASMFDSLSNDMFDSEPSKVVFGFCISDCAGTGSNVNGNQAVEIMSDLKTINDGEFSCNGGAFFWVALHDQGGVWSDAVVDEVSKSAGCSTGATTSSTTTITSEPETSTSTPTAAPETTTTSTTSGGTLLVDRQHRCGVSEAEARGNCAKVCSDQGDCGSGEWCWQVFDNYCGSLPDKIFVGTPVLDATPRCGTSELDARGLCKNTCVSDADCDTSLGEKCQGVNQNYCDSPYTHN